MEKHTKFSVTAVSYVEVKTPTTLEEFSDQINDVPVYIDIHGDKTDVSYSYTLLDVKIGSRSDNQTLIELNPVDLTNKIKTSETPVLDNVFIQYINMYEDEVRWVDEDEPRTHTAIYARLMDGTLCHVMDFTDKEHALVMLGILREFIAIDKK